MNLNNTRPLQHILLGTVSLKARTPVWGTSGNWEYWSSGTAVSVAAFLEPLSAEEISALGGPFPNVAKRLFVAGDVSLDRNYEVIDSSGGTYEVLGETVTFEDPFTGTAHHKEAIVVLKS